MSRLAGIVETERVAAVATDELRVASPSCHEADAMSAAHADGRMRDVQLLVAFRFQEGVATMARELAKAITVHDHVHLMSEETAAVADLLIEHGRIGVGGVVNVEDERVAALHAGVLAMLVSIDHLGVGVVAEEAGQRVPDVSVPVAAMSARLSGRSAPPACLVLRLDRAETRGEQQDWMWSQIRNDGAPTCARVCACRSGPTSIAS